MTLIGRGLGTVAGILGHIPATSQHRERVRIEQEQRRADFAADLRSRYPAAIEATVRLHAGEDCGMAQPDRSVP